MSGLPTPDLAYGIQPPATVYVTLDETEPVYNTLVVNVMNASTSPVGFNNPEGLTPSSDLPAITDTTPNPLDRMYIWFPWGDGAGDLSYPGDAPSIVGSSLSPGWAPPVRLTDPTIGVYWILFPLSTSVLLGPQESVQFDFSQIVSHLPATQTTGMTIAYVEPRVAGWASTTSTIDVFKDQPLGIASFTALPTSVLPGGSATVSWSTTGASDVRLDPGGHTGLPESSHMDVPVSKPTTFTLTAYAAGRAPVEQRQAVSVQTGWVSMTGGQGSPFYGHPMALYGLDAGLVYLSATGTWSSSADAQSWTLVAETNPLGDRIAPYAGVFGGELWLMGGFVNQSSSALNDVWSSVDGGVTWEQAGTAQWSPRSGGGCVSFLDRLWIAGGTQGNYAAPVPPVSDPLWSSADGVSWTSVDVPWSPRVNCGLAVWDGRLWMSGGVTPAGYLADTWSTSDGVTWEESAQPAQWGNYWPALVATPSTLYAITHSSAMGSGLWTLDGSSWSAVAQPPPFGGVDYLYGPTYAFAPFQSHPMAAGRDDIWVYSPPAG